MAAPVIPTNMFDRGTQFTTQLMRGDPGAAVQAVFQPEQLTPEQLGLKADGSTPWGAAMNLVKNPFVWIGAVLAMKYPLKGAKEMVRRLAVHESNYNKVLIPGLGKLYPATEMMRGSRFGELFTDLVNVVYEKRAEWQKPAGRAALASEAATGRSASIAEQVASSMVTEGGHLGTIAEGTEKAVAKQMMPGQKTWTYTRELLRRRQYEIKYGQQYEPNQVRTWYDDHADPAIETLVREKFATGINRANVEALHRPELVAGMKEMNAQIMYDLTHDEEVFLNVMMSRAKKGEGKALAAAAAEVAKKTGKDVTPVDMLRMLREGGVEFPGLAEDPKVAREMWKKLNGMTREQMMDAIPNGYLPHVEARTADNLELQSKIGKLYTDGLPSKASKEFQDPISRRLFDRNYGEMMDPQSLEFLNKAAPGTVDQWIIDGIKEAQTSVHASRVYTLRWNSIVESSTRTVARTYGWVGKGLGPQIVGEIEGPMKTAAGQSASGRLRYQAARETLVPAALGQMDENETMHALQWTSHKKAMYDYLDSDASAWIPEGFRETGKKVMLSPTVQDLTWRNAGAKIAHFYYASTLGLNATSAGLNLMQNLMSTAGIVPAKYVGKGFERATAKMGPFLSEYAGGADFDKAFLKHFPEWEHVGGQTEIDMLNAMRRLDTGFMSASTHERLERGKQMLMRMFTTTERGNKMWAYYAGESWAKAEGLAPLEARKVGTQVVQESQFPGGLLGTPVGLLNWWAPFRQFTQFPIRTMMLGLRDPGTAGRMMLAGSLVYGAGQAAGLDLSRGLVFGALPEPYSEDSPFYPLPVVPPLVQAVGAVASDAYGGKLEQIPRLLPTLVPGGVAMSRAVGYVPGAGEAIAPVIGRPYADYTRPQANGSYPVYTAEGVLRGYETPTRMIANSLGAKSLTGDKEAVLMKYLIAQRDKLRGFHREYVDSLARNDAAGAEEVQQRYQKEYPNLGPLAVRKADIRAVHLRKDVSRIERLLETMPPEARAQYGALISGVMGEMTPGFMGVDPAVFSQGGSIKSREGARTATPTTVGAPGTAGGPSGPLGREEVNIRMSPMEPPKQKGGFRSDGGFGAF